MKGLAILPPDRWMEINLLDTLRSSFCDELHVFNYPGGMGQLGSKSWRAQRDRLNHRLTELAATLKSSGRLDFIFCIVYDDFLLVETAKKLRELRVPLVNYHVDMAFQWYRVIRTAPYFDVMAVAQLTNADHLTAHTANIHWMPMAANPSFYFRAATLPTHPEPQVSFVGSFNPFRRALLSACVRNGMRPVVYGRGWNCQSPSPYRFPWGPYKILHDLRYYAAARWKAEGPESVVGPLRRKCARGFPFEDLEGVDFRGPCSDESLPTIFNESQVNLGFSDTGWHSATRVRQSGNLQCRLRDFEVPMAGGLYLVQEAPDHEQYYTLGEEIITWSQPEELVDKVRFYTRNAAAAMRIREAGQRRVLREHTWERRFDRLFSLLRSQGKLA